LRRVVIKPNKNEVFAMCVCAVFIAGVFVCASGISAATVRSDAGPIAWWHLDENTGDVVCDSAGDPRGR